MATVSPVEGYLLRPFDLRHLEPCPEEWGCTRVSDRPVRRVGHATNLAPEVAREAVSQGVDLVLTHHDAR